MRSIVTGLLVLAASAGSARAAGAAQPASPFRSIGPAIPVPPALAASETGPRTDYYSNGRPRSHGLYVMRGDRSVAQGVFTFWAADGRRQSQGRYADGQPVGCFAVWLAGGQRITGFAEQGGLRVASCDPPSHAAADVIEDAHGEGGEPIIDLSFQSFVAPWSPLGARTSKYATSDPEMTGALMVLWRRHVGEARFGGAAGVRGAEYGYYGLTATGLGGWGRRLSSWLAVDAWGELGILFMQAKPQLEDHREGREYLWTPLSAAQAEASWRVSSSLEVTTAARFELRFPRSVDRQTIFCRAPCDPMTDTWKTGGIAAGVVLGFRFLVW